jgi:hypothetical protein
MQKNCFTLESAPNNEIIEKEKKNPTLTNKNPNNII